jgi:preprotein translocase subunit SecG
MRPVLLILQIIVAFVLIGIIVLQAKGTGLGRSFGATTYHAKRGMEKTLFYLTIGTSILFVVLAAINAF